MSIAEQVKQHEDRVAEIERQLSLLVDMVESKRARIIVYDHFRGPDDRVVVVGKHPLTDDFIDDYFGALEHEKEILEKGLKRLEVNAGVLNGELSDRGFG